jgi:hypothetical protein
VGRLLRQLGYSLRANVKKQAAKATHSDRNTKFEQIQTQRQRFEAAQCPIISIDTKKKELIGNYKNAGQAWKEQREAVNAYDFPQDALGKAVPYGIYDVLHNCGTVYVGSLADTSGIGSCSLLTLLGNPSDLACLRMLGEETKERVQRDAQRLEKEDDIATTT